MNEITIGSFSLKKVGNLLIADLLRKNDGKFTASIPLLIKSSLTKCVLAFVLRRSLHTGQNNLYWVVSKMMAVTTLYSAES